MSLREYNIRGKGLYEKKKEEWDVARWQMFLAMQMHPYIKSHQKPKTPQSWIQFAWEKDQTEINVEDVMISNIQEQALNNILQTFINKRKN